MPSGNGEQKQHTESGEGKARFEERTARLVRSNDALRAERDLLTQESARLTKRYTDAHIGFEMDRASRLATLNLLEDATQARDALMRENAERRRSEERLQALIRNLPGGAAFILDRDLRYMLAEGEALRSAGFKPEDFVGKTVYEALSPDLIASYEPKFLKALAGESFVHEHEAHGRSFLSRGTPLASGNAEFDALLVVSYDITERKRDEAALTASREQLRLLVESALEHAIISLELDRRVVSWNSGAERAFGYSKDEMIGEIGDVIFTAEDRAAGVPQAEAETALLQGRAGDDRWLVRKDGSQFWANGAMVPMRNGPEGEPIGFVKILRDETHLREMQETLHKQQEELMRALMETRLAREEVELASKAKDQFLASLSHELRTPLTPVVMAVHALTKRDDMPPAARAALEMIHRNIKIESDLIDDLLDLTRISRGLFDIGSEPVDLHAAIAAAVEVSESDIGGKQQRLTVDLQATEYTTIGDFTKLQQAMWNLLKNASKFTPHGGEISIATCNVGENFVATVTDTGTGIDPNVLAIIFDPFRQGSESISREFGGLGLGLAITKATIQQHGGTVRAESTGRGEGSTFIVELPLRAAPAMTHNYHEQNQNRAAA